MRLRRIISSPWFTPIRGLLRPIEVAIAIVWMKKTLRRSRERLDCDEHLDCDGVHR